MKANHSHELLEKLSGSFSKPPEGFAIPKTSPDENKFDKRLLFLEDLYLLGEVEKSQKVTSL